MENSHLVKLIKSLKKNEKRFISMQLSRHKSSNNLLLLYTLISDAKHISDEVIENKIPDKKFLSQLKINKHNLYYFILDALHTFHLRGSVYGRILNMLHQAELLLAKGLIPARHELLVKAGKLADKYELSELKLEVLRLLNHEPDKEGLAKGIYNETKRLSARILQENTIKYLNNQMSFYQRKVGQRLNNTQMKYVEKQALKTISAENFKGQTFFNRFFYYRMLSLYHTMAGRTQEAFENDSRLITLFKDDPHMSDLQIWKDRYYSAISRLITSSASVGRNDMLPHLSTLVQQSDISEKRKIFIDINILDAYMQTGEFEGSKSLLFQIEEDIDRYHRNLGPSNRTALYFNLAVLNFGMENYSRSLHWINTILNNPDNRGDNVGINTPIRIIRLMLYYELSYFDILEYELRSTYRYISKQKHLHKFDQIVIRFIRKTVMLSSKASVKKLMENTRNDLVKLLKIKTEQQTLSYFDFISWLESKLENKKFAEVVKEKACIKN